MAASESCGHRSSAASLATTSNHRQPIYRRSEPKPILSSARSASSRRARNNLINSNISTSNIISNSHINNLNNNNNNSGSVNHINGSSAVDNVLAIKRLEPLTIEEYEQNYRLGSTDLELIERVFLGSCANNQIRAALWPYLFGLIVHRGRFEKVPNRSMTSSLPSSGGDYSVLNGSHSPLASPNSKRSSQGIENIFNSNNKTEYVFIEHEANAKRWKELEQLYLSYEAQWKAITRDQEERFTLFRERKSLIGRDVIRCDRLHPFYADQPRNLDRLSSLLMTYMMFDFDIGYVQGMSDLAGPILYIFEGDLIKSFWVFVEVMKLVRRNFEHTQKSIHFQLSCLFELIRITDAKFAKYLENQESSNCFFAFRAIVCQFKRELMKDEVDYYDKCLQLWDTIWCVERRCVLEANLVAMNQGDLRQGNHNHNSNHNHNNNNNYNNSSPRSLSNHNHHLHFHNGASWKSIPHYLTSFSSPLAKSPLLNGNTTTTTTASNGVTNGTTHTNDGAKWAAALPARDQNQPDTPRHNLTETEMFILALCLVMILRERDTILSRRLDGNDIHLHFIEPKLANNLNGFIQSAINTYRIMKNDLDLTRLTSPRKTTSLDDDTFDEQPMAAHLAPLFNIISTTSNTGNNSQFSPPSTTTASSSSTSFNPLEEFHLGSPGSLEGYDFLNDFLIINRVPGR